MEYLICGLGFLAGFIIGGMVVKLTPPPKFFLVLLTRKTRQIALIIPGQSRAACLMKWKTLSEGGKLPEHGLLEIYDQAETNL